MFAQILAIVRHLPSINILFRNIQKNAAERERLVVKLRESKGALKVQSAHSQDLIKDCVESVEEISRSLGGCTATRALNLRK